MDEPVVWVFPPEHQSMSMHPELVKNTTVARGLAQIDKHHKMKKILISLNDELQKIYFDDDLNVCFRDQLLDDKPVTQTVQPLVQSGMEKKILSLLLKIW